MIWNDNGDPEKAFAAWGDKNVTITSMPVTVLGSRTKEECVDYAKDMLDRYAGQGRMIFSFDKVMVTKNDCDMENLKAVLKTVREYR